MAKKNTVATVSQPIQENDVLVDKFAAGEDFLQRNRNLLIGLVVAVVLVVGGLVAYNYYKNMKNEEAQSLMFPAVYYFEADSLQKALNGDGANEGLVAIAEDYGMTKAGNLAKFYAGAAYLKQGKFDDAIEYLQDFSSDDLLIQARAYALTGDAYMEKNNLAEAVNFYRKAADYKPNEFFTPAYLMKLALAQELNKDNQAAIETYDRIATQYPKSAEAVNAIKYKSKLTGSAGQ
jgi:predicted negative regulator of RcsB-dependent stress response